MTVTITGCAGKQGPHQIYIHRFVKAMHLFEIYLYIHSSSISDHLSVISLSMHTLYEAFNSFTGAEEQGRRQAIQLG